MADEENLTRWTVRSILSRSHLKAPYIPIEASVVLASPGSLFSPTSPTEFWALIAGVGAVATAIATGILAIMAGLGLKSLGLAQASIGLAQKDVALAQKDMLNKAKREARGCTVIRCNELAQEILPLRWSLNTELAKAKIPVFIKDPATVQFGGEDEKAKVHSAKAWKSLLSVELENKCVQLVNRVEVWSMYFTNGLADHEMGAIPCSHVYCSMVIQMYPFLIESRASGRSGQFANTVGLFEQWHGKQKTQKLLQELEEIQTRATSLPKVLGMEDEG